MVREIKFRAWWEKGKTMFPFVAVHQTGDACFGGAWYRAEDVVLMQYTGLSDKENKRIYEGDVVAEVIDGERGDMYVIEWSRDGNHSYYAGYRTDDRSLETEMQLFELGALEILGNIYENPELLNQ